MADTLERKPEDKQDDALNPANRSAPKIDTEPGTTDMSEFEREFDGNPSAPIVGNNLRGRENKPPKKAGGNAESLKDQEESAPDRSGFSAADDINEKLGRGYTGKGSTQSKGLSKLFSSNSALKKKVALAGAAAGGSLLVSILVFLAMLPLKIEHIMNNLDSHFAAASENALEKETENLYTSYVKKNVLPYLGTKGCHSTVDASCVFGAEGSGPLGKLYKSWSQGRLEQKMASNYGIVLQRSGSGSGYTLSLHGHDYDIHGGDIFNLSDTHHASTYEVRQAIRSSFKDATLYDKVYTRFKLGKLLEAKYGIKRCILACSIRDNFNDKVADKKLAAKAYLVERVIGPFSDEYSLLIQCVVSGGCSSTTPDGQAPEPDENGNSERTSQFQRDMQSRLDAYAERYGSRALSSLVSDADEISKNGFNRYLLVKILNKLGVDATSETVDKVADPIGWLKAATNIVNSINKLGQLKVMGYAIKSAAAAELYMQYRDVADEMKSGHMDTTELGSFADQLSNLAKDDNGNVSDATASPLYGKLMGGGNSTTASILGDMFSGSAYADAPSSTYKCNNGKPVPAGQTVCPEEDFTTSNSTVDSVESALNGNPAWQVLKEVSSVIGGVMNEPCPINPLNCLGDAVNWVLGAIPGFSDITNLLGSLVSPLFNFITQQLIPSPFSANMSGGRTFDMLAAGSDVSQNKGCQVSLGCAQASDATVAKIQNEQLAEQKQEFDSMPMFARIFNTDSSYSLVSRLAMDMPTDMLSATNQGFAGLISNPFGKISSAFSSVFSGSQAFAAQTAQPDPFGVVQNAYTNIPGDSDTFWSNNCVDGPLGLYTPATDTSPDSLNVSPWLSNDTSYPDPMHPGKTINFTSSNWDGKAGQNNTADDANTGETYNVRENPCLLIHAAIQSSGGAFNPDLLPQDSQNDNNGSSSTPPSGGTSGDAASLAQQVLANPNITLQKSCTTGADATPSGCAYQDIQAASQGQKVTPGKIEGQSNGGASTGACSARTPEYLDATLLQGMLNIASKYKYTIQDIDSGHDCDSGRHPMGRAFDITAVNGVSIGGHCTDPDVYGFLKYVATTMSALMPNGSYPHEAGIGSCTSSTPSWIPTNINYFFDSSDEIHVDTGVPS